MKLLKMKLSKMATISLFFTLCLSNSSLAQGPKGDFDYYVLALSWQPAFCETMPHKPECISQTNERFDARNFVLHGLWPNVASDHSHSYGYCNVPKNLVEKDQSGQWCELPELKLSQTLRNQLRTFMPGAYSCLQRHEWYKHGICSGLSENDYYAVCSKLVSDFSETKFNKLISENTGKYVERKTLLKAFDKEFGKGTSRYLELKCKSVKGKKLLSEIRIYLQKDLSAWAHLKDLFPKEKVRIRGGCPKKFKIDAVGN